jgi:dipeptidyl aminopeptidase/acylaminoacyl peptidase
MSPDGTRLAVTRNGFLYLADVAAPHSPRGTVLLAVRDAQGDPVPGWGASWSPDGTKLALAGQASGLSVVRPDGNGRYEVVSGRDGGGPARDAEWAPAGDRIAFSMGPPEATHLYIVEAARSDGRNVRPSQVTTDPQYTERWPHWSPDGTEVLFTRGSNGSPPVGADAISFILSLRTGVARQIGGGRNRGEVGVGWSRLDGRVYLVEHQAGAQPQLVSLKPDGTDRREIAARSVPAGRIDWVPADARWGSTFLLPSPVSPLTSGRAAKARPPVGVPSPR